MARKDRSQRQPFFGGRPQQSTLPVARAVTSLLDEMTDGNELGSIIALRPANGELVPELRRAIADLETVRQRRCICYVANVIKNAGETSIDSNDHLPFNEMMEKIPAKEQAVDVFLVTPGGFADK